MIFAVHISDGVLTTPWIAAGFALAALLVGLAAWRIRDDEVPRVAILTAAFFVSSLIHIRVGPTSIHLLLTGLVGVMLGRRSALAIAVGLLMQVLLIGHGGWSTLGVNACVMTLPALLCGLLFQVLHRLPWLTEPAARRMMVGCGALALYFSSVYSVALLCNTPLTSVSRDAFEAANDWLINPWIIGGAILFVAGAIVLEGRLENTPDFPLGFLVGELAVLLTVGLNCVTLIAGGENEWPVMPLLLVIAHLPFAVIEGLILGVIVGFVEKVKPEMLGRKTGFTAEIAESAKRDCEDKTPIPTLRAPRSLR
jgi:ABC-type Co2+ transport system permease subunit